MRIGALRHRVTLENPGSPVPDGDGGFTQVWTVLSSGVSASVEPVSARSLERVMANTVSSMASHLVTLRYRPGVTTQTRVTFHDVTTDRVMAVTGVHDTEERHLELVLECKESI